MSADLGQISFTQLQNLYQQQQMSTKPAGTWSLNAWDVCALKADSGSVVGSTWIPRSYSCCFCAREFRSAQALGGHMNVHRRDRARLRHSPPAGHERAESFSATISTDFVAAGPGSHLFYPIPKSGAAGTRCFVLPAGTASYPEKPCLLNLLPMSEDCVEGAKCGLVGDHNVDDGMMVDEIDLELRLGW